MAELTIPNGLSIRIHLNQIFQVQKLGERTILKAMLNASVVEFEVLETYEFVAQLHGTRRQ